jgi:hypothetical protein
MLNSNERIIKHKAGLLNLADELENVAKACKMVGVSRDTLLGCLAACCLNQAGRPGRQ